MKFIRNILDKIAQYLPDDEPATEQERFYEEGKKRIYEMHQREADLFYVEQAWQEKAADRAAQKAEEKALSRAAQKAEGRIYGEVAKGRFREGDALLFLDVHGNPLGEAVLSKYKEDPEGERDPNQSAKRAYLHFECREILENGNFFAQVSYVIKKH